MGEEGKGKGTERKGGKGGEGNGKRGGDGNGRNDRASYTAAAFCLAKPRAGSGLASVRGRNLAHLITTACTTVQLGVMIQYRSVKTMNNAL